MLLEAAEREPPNLLSEAAPQDGKRRGAGLVRYYSGENKGHACFQIK